MDRLEKLRQLAEEERRDKQYNTKLKNVLNSTRYTLGDMEHNKIIGIKLPCWEKVCWGVFHKNSIFTTRSIKVTTTDWRGREMKFNRDYFLLGDILVNEDNLDYCLNELYTLPINYIVSVDISKTHISPIVDGMGYKELMNELEELRRYVDTQRLFEVKAKLLQFPKKKEKQPVKMMTAKDYEHVPKANWARYY